MNSLIQIVFANGNLAIAGKLWFIAIGVIAYLVYRLIKKGKGS
jgi:hypothetical protein